MVFCCCLLRFLLSLLCFLFRFCMLLLFAVFWLVFNVFLRDNFTCQYCNQVFLANDLTFDHVTPRSKGGRSRWENVVTACSPCNLKKSNKLSNQCNMYPQKKPVIPTVWQLQDNGRKFPPNHLHDSWRDYLYWDSELMER